MAKFTVVKVVDDLDGTESPDAETVTFALDGTTYEIDLSPKNNEKLRAALATFIDHARPAGRTTAYKTGLPRSREGDPTGPVTVLPASDAGAVRAWAKARGLEVPARGRIPASLREQYYAAKQ